MSVSDPGEKIEWGADSEPRKNERVPSSGIYFSFFKGKINDEKQRGFGKMAIVE
jgi:hypothetical protein